MTAIALLLAQDKEKEIEPLKEHVELVKKFIEACLLKEDKDREKALVPLVHECLKKEDSDELDRDFVNYRNKRNIERLNAKWYVLPAVVAKGLSDQKIVRITWRKKEAEGTKYRYFLKRDTGHGGFKNTGWITLFVPKGGGTPVVLDVQM